MNNDWLKQSDSSSLGKILFENGYYDFHKQNFYTEFNPDYVFFGKIHHKFETFDADDELYMDSIVERLFYQTLGKEVGDFLILNLARGLSGECMKRLLFVLGDPNTGKGVITTAVSHAIGDYFGAFNAESLAHRETSQDPAQVMRFMLLLRYKRIVISNEIQSKVELAGNFLKKFASGGDPLVGRTHCGEETTFIAHFLGLIFANDINKITPYDPAVDTRVRCATFTKTFVEGEPANEFELKMDMNIKDEVKTARFQRCFVGLLMKYHADYMDGGKQEVEPLGVKNSKKEWIESTIDKNPVVNFLKDYEITNVETDYVKSKDIQEWIEKNSLGISITKFGRELNKYATLNKLENLQYKDKKIKGKTSRVWIGVKQRESDDELEEG